MKEIRIDLRVPNDERHKEGQRTTKLLFQLHHTLPFSDEYHQLLQELFPDLGKDCYIATPLYMNLANNIHIGNHVSINPYFRCMSAGNVFIEEYAQIAMGVSIITNNHDFYDRPVLTVQDVRIEKNTWIGAGAIILPGVTIGENAIVGAGSVVTHDVAPNTIVAGNPAKTIRALDASKFHKQV